MSRGHSPWVHMRPPSAAGGPGSVRQLQTGSCRHQHRPSWVGSRGWVRTGGTGDVTTQVRSGAGSKGQRRKPEGSLQGWQPMPGELGTPGRALGRTSMPTEWGAELGKAVWTTLSPAQVRPREWSFKNTRQPTLLHGTWT